ncbi:hypothetical protein [Nocardioides sp.]|uniref:hypothetical protein n=1 Tax=Nocardioides sp. TaxID=35761 RepID=UPI00286E0D5B|nr:hypothetical protein [Nocardioides sp.]
MRVWAAALIVVLSLSACASSDEPSESDGPKAAVSSAGSSKGPMDDFPVGSSAPFAVYAHCGVEFTTIDGTTWRTAPRDDGQGNAPTGWPERIPGTLTRPADDRAVFTASEMPVEFVFKPAPDAKFHCD